jgi:hypothetical protein
MVQAHTNFKAQTNGFRFVNRFNLPFSTNVKLPIVGEIDLSKVVYGLCGGMCFAALDYYNVGRPVPGYTQVGQFPQGYLTYLWDRQLDSLGLVVLPKVIEWMLRADTDVAVRVCRYEVPKMRRQLDQGKPVVLGLVRGRGVEDPTQNHQVLVEGYDLDDATQQMVLYLYEPNYPGITPTLSLSLTRPSQGIQLKQSTGEVNRGFFVINYSAQQPPA